MLVSELPYSSFQNYCILACMLTPDMQPGKLTVEQQSLKPATGFIHPTFVVSQLIIM
jgi:hypothetical protein